MVGVTIMQRCQKSDVLSQSVVPELTNMNTLRLIIPMHTIFRNLESPG